MLYLKKFKTHSEYEEYMEGNPLLPNVSICEDEPSTVHYNKYVPPVALTFTASEDDTVICLSKNGSPTQVTLEYSTNDGVTWQNYTFGNTITLAKGDRLNFRNTSETTTNFSTNSYNGYYRFAITGKASVAGDITYLINRNGNVDTIPNNSCFGVLFSGCTGLSDASGLVLPSTALTSSCYAYMFQGCTSLVKAPTVLPATALVSQCYWGMFQNCTSLTTAPTVLSATSLVSQCCQSMFMGCTSLTDAPLLPATTLVSNCYNQMFQGCTSLSSVTCLAITKPQSSPSNMWLYNVAPKGVFTRNLNYDWEIGQGGIPEGWTVINRGLKVVPNTGVISYNVSTVTTEIIKGEDVGTLTASSTAGWVTSCTINGKSLNISFIENTTQGARTGVVTVTDGNYSATYTVTQGYAEKGEGLTIVAVEPNSKVSLIKYGSPTVVDMEISIDGGESWCPHTIGDEVSLNRVGESVMFRNASPITTEFSTGNTFGLYYFSIDGKCSVKNDITYLINRNGNVATIPNNNCFASLFSGCTGLTDASGLVLPSATLKDSCYYRMFAGCMSLTTAPSLPAETMGTSSCEYMFSGCTSLTTAPSLPATVLGTNCYRYMFQGCRSLTAAPTVLPATALTGGCYWQMFADCTSLTTAPALPATTLADFCYRNMFNGCTSLTAAPVISAETMGSYSCDSMFQGCTSLVKAPELPATTLVSNCYNQMFQGCTSLVKAPELPATTLDSNCYQYMFQGCTSLTTAPTELPATALTSYCYQYMFAGCTSLVKAPELPATTLANYCYAFMFADCTSLTDAPSLPATTLSYGCYSSMFLGCTSLTTAPTVLPATTLTGNCYGRMFADCTSLTTAPSLPATVLDTYCYGDMFNGCTSLTSVSAMATSITASNSTNNWLSGVPETGVFYRSPLMDDWEVNSPNGIPAGWTVEPQLEVSGLTFTAIEDNSSVALNKVGNPTSVVLEYTTDGYNWLSYTIGTSISLANAGDKVKFHNTSTTTTEFSTSDENYYYFSITGECATKKDVSYLINSDGNVNTLPNDGCFSRLFENCSGLTDASRMTLSATELTDGCYSGMFKNCTSLTAAPSLSAATLTDGCYSEMFYGCTNLGDVTCLATAQTSANTYNWMSGVAQTGVFHRYMLLDEWLTDSPHGIPAGWTIDPPIEHGLSFIALEAPVMISLERHGNPTQRPRLEYLDEMGRWRQFMEGMPIDIHETGRQVKVRSMYPDMTIPFGTNYDKYYSFRIREGKCKVKGDLTYLINQSGNVTDLSSYNYCFANLFSGCSTLVDASELTLPSTVLSERCYTGMFYDCTSLSAAPLELPAVDLKTYCYENMFRNCESLTVAPKLVDAENQEYGCYENMFAYCYNLAEVTCLLSEVYEQNSYWWLQNVSSTGTFTKKSGVNWPTGENGIPNNWTVIEV